MHIVPRKTVRKFRKMRVLEHITEHEHIIEKVAPAARTLPLAEGKRLFGEWAGLATVIMRCGFQVVAIPGGSIAAELVLSMVGVDNTQTRLLKSIKADTELLRNQPFQTAKLYLTEARRVGPQDVDEWINFIRAAQKELYSAHSLALGAHEMAVVEFDLYLVWALLGREPDAMHWLALSLKSAEQAIDTFTWSLRAYIEDSRQGRKKRSRLEKVIDFLEENLLLDVRDSIRDPVVTAVQVSIEVAVDLVDRSQSTAIMERIKVLDDYIKFYNLVNYSMNVSHGWHNPDYLELFDTYLKRPFNRDINHYASLDDGAPRKCLQLRNAQGTS
jgi:hypothetical protein